MKKIELNGCRGKGKFAMVDDDDFDRLNEFSWYVSSNGYVVSTVNDYKNNKSYKLYMHREVVNAPKDKYVDHKKGNKLDNQKASLRICENGMNRANSVKKSKATSKFKGIHKTYGKWRGTITINKKMINLGIFSNEIDAAKAYDRKAIELFGEFAKLNFPVNA